jgi:hypothetical protein
LRRIGTGRRAVAKEILMIGKLQPKLAKAGIGMTDAEAPTTARAA